MNCFERHCRYYFQGCDFDCRVREKEKHLEYKYYKHATVLAHSQTFTLLINKLKPTVLHLPIKIKHPIRFKC
jgi:hypothetical protein